MSPISLGSPDTFDGRSNTAYKDWLEAIHPTPVMSEYVSFINTKVTVEEDGVWTTGKVQCLFQDILHDVVFDRQQHLDQQKSVLFDCVGG